MFFPYFPQAPFLYLVFRQKKGWFLEEKMRIIGGDLVQGGRMSFRFIAKELFIRSFSKTPETKLKGGEARGLCGKGMMVMIHGKQNFIFI